MFKEDKPLSPKPRLFTQGQLLGGTLLWDEFVKMNKGKEPVIIYLTGDRDQAQKQFRKQMKNIPNDQLVYIAFEIEDTELNLMDKDPQRPRDVIRHIAAVDSAGELKQSVKELLKGRCYLNQFHFYLYLGEYTAAKNLHLYRISLGKNLYSDRRLQNRKMMRKPLDNIAELIKSNYPGYTCTTYSRNPAIIHFLETRGLRPKRASSISGRYERADIYYMIRSYEGYKARTKDMLIAKLPQKPKRGAVKFAGSRAPLPVIVKRGELLDKEFSARFLLDCAS